MTNTVISTSSPFTVKQIAFQALSVNDFSCLKRLFTSDAYKLSEKQMYLIHDALDRHKADKLTQTNNKRAILGLVMNLRFKPLIPQLCPSFVVFLDLLLREVSGEVMIRSQAFSSTLMVSLQVPSI